MYLIYLYCVKWWKCHVLFWLMLTHTSVCPTQPSWTKNGSLVKIREGEELSFVANLAKTWWQTLPWQKLKVRMVIYLLLSYSSNLKTKTNKQIKKLSKQSDDNQNIKWDLKKKKKKDSDGPKSYYLSALPSHFLLMFFLCMTGVCKLLGRQLRLSEQVI